MDYKYVIQQPFHDIYPKPANLNPYLRYKYPVLNEKKPEIPYVCFLLEKSNL